MKRLLPCVLFVLAIAGLASPEAFAQGRPSRTPPSLPPPSKNVYDTLAAQKDLSEFAKMVDEAGLKSMLSGSPDEPVTVLAPSNDALDKLSKDQSHRIEASKASLQGFVKYHVITGSLMTSSAIKGRKSSPASADGETLMFDGTNRNDAPKIGDGTLTHMDIMATNGVIHVVSAALVPPSLGGASSQPAMPMPPPPPSPVAATKAAAPTKAAAKVPESAKPTADTTTAGTPESMPSKASETTTGTPMDQTTSGVPSSETTTGAVPEVTPDQPAQQPVPPPATGDDSSGNTSIWKKMGW